MRYSKNPELPSRRGAVLPVRICLAACVLLVSVTTWARDIRIEYAASKLVEGVYYADARIHFDLDEDILLALEHGVAIDIHTLLRVRRDGAHFAGKKTSRIDPIAQLDIERSVSCVPELSPIVGGTEG